VRSDAVQAVATMTRKERMADYSGVMK
jgi:hypothetical protein